MGSKPGPGTFGSMDPQVRAEDASDRLNSWKDIAVYLSRDVRTVLRWEKNEELPVHRHLHGKGASVYAFKSEIDRWWSNRRPRLESEPEPAPVPGEVFDDTEEIEFDSSRRPSVVTDSWYRFKQKILIAVVALAAIAIGAYATRYFVTTRKQVAIMVVPFSNLNVDPYFSAGITEELMRQLGEMNPKRVRVIALPLAALDKLPKDPENLAHDLKPDYVLRGSVQRASERVRITAQLIRVDDHTQVFDESYEGELQEALKVQADVAQTIAARINLTVSPTLRSDAQPVNPAAHDAYLQGLYAMGPRTPSAIYSALSYFEKAVTLQPDYAEAHSGIADCYTLLGSIETGALPPREAMPRAKRAALKALELHPNLAQAHASLAHITLVYDWNLEVAHKEFQKAIELNPSYPLAHQWYGLYWNAVGDTEHALTEIRQAQELDPLSPATRTAMAEAYYFAHDYPKAIDESKAALELNPNFILGYLNLGRALEQSGQLPEAVQAFERGRELSFKGPGMTMFLSHALALQGKRDESKKFYAYLEQYAANGPKDPLKGGYVPALYFAAIQGGLGNKDEAFRLLEKAYDERCEYLIYLDREPMADFLHPDPRFEPLLKKIGLR